MSLADKLLNDYTANNVVDAVIGDNIIVGADRFITVPDNLKKLGVQYDHDVETLTFDCPRYWDGIDLSKMLVYINYLRSDGVPGSYLCEKVTVDAGDDSIMHFDWVISGHVTEVAGNIAFLVCIKKNDGDGIIVNHWNSELNSDLYVSEGMECREAILRKYPDIIAQLLTRMDVTEETNAAWKSATYDEFIGRVEALENENTNWRTDTFNELDGHLAENEQTALGYMESASTSASAAQTSAASAAASAEEASGYLDDVVASANAAAASAEEASGYLDSVATNANAAIESAQKAEAAANGFEADIDSINERIGAFENVEISDGTLGDFSWGAGLPDMTGFASMPYNMMFYDPITELFITESTSAYFSEDGKNWTASTYNPNQLYDMAYGEGKYVFVGSFPYALGVVCTNKPIDKLTGNGDFLTKTITDGGQGVCYSVAYGNGRFVAVGYKGLCYYSEDGITWSPGSTGLTSDIKTVIFANGYFLTAPTSATYNLKYSTDGATWSDAKPTSAAVNKLIYANGVYLALCYTSATNATIKYTTDPVNSSWTTVLTTTDGQLRGGCYGNGRFVVVGDNGEMYISSDGLNWQFKSATYSTNMCSITYGKGIFVIGTETGTLSAKFDTHDMSFNNAINTLYNKKLPYGLFRLQSSNWVSNSAYSGYTYAYEVPISDFYDAYPEYFLKPASTTALVPTTAEQTAFELIGGMRLDVVNMKLIFYASSKPSTSILVIVKGVTM